MAGEERRAHPRARLRLCIDRAEGLWRAQASGDLWTSDISSEGMYFQAALREPPAPGTPLAFELNVPPGEGYSALAGKVRGAAKVVRTVALSDGRTGIGVRFTRPLALHF